MYKDTPAPATSTIDPSILYFGTPVMLLATLNPDGTTNLAPTSSAFWIGHSGVLGLGARSQTFINLSRHGELVVNMVSEDLAAAVDRLAATTGVDPVPAYKRAMGFVHVADKFARAGLTPLASAVVKPLRVAECPFQIECTVERMYTLGPADERSAAVEVRAIRTHVHDAVRQPGHRHHINPDAWRPLIMNFLEFYGLTAERTRESHLAEVFE